MTDCNSIRAGLIATVAACLTVSSIQNVLAQPDTMFRFRDVGREAGILPAAEKIQGHGAGWGDADGDGWADLYVATFHYPETQPNLFFRNREGRFELDNQPQLRISTRATGVLFVDLDNDGDLDLYVTSMPAPEDSKLATRMGHPFNGCTLFRNEGGGRFTNISAENESCPAAFGGRSVAALDFDGDGLLDLLVGEDPIPGYNGSTTKSSRLFRNTGELQFKDVSREAGLPENRPGLGVAAADVNADGWPDFFLAAPRSNELFLNDGRGHFTTARGASEVFAWPTSGGDDMVCGAVIGDVNGDTRPDIVLGQHYSTPWIERVPNRLYLNRGMQDGVPQFEDVTQAAGLIPLPLKAPHVELQDFDNDGRPDLYCSIVKFAGGRAYPLIFRNSGTENGLPKFKEDTLAVNDFPDEEDVAMKRSGTFFEKMIRDGKIIYMAPGPSADFDRDGRLDLFLANWWAESPSLLLKNETPSGHWLDVRLEVTTPQNGRMVNRMGIGSRIEIFDAGKAGQPEALLGVREIATGFGYASSQEAIAHFGLGERSHCDVVVTLPHGGSRVVKSQVSANQRLVMTR